MKNSSDHQLMDYEDDDFLLCKKSKKFISFMIQKISTFSFNSNINIDIIKAFMTFYLLNLFEECSRSGRWDNETDTCSCAGDCFGKWCENDLKGTCCLKI